MFTGTCLCTGVKFRIDLDALAPIQICHCRQCRKAQGTAIVTNTPVPASAFHLLEGAELLRAYESSPGKQRWFCGRCGSPVYSRRESLPDVVRIRIGLLDGDLTAPLEAHYHVESKANWWPITDALPQR